MKQLSDSHRAIYLREWRAKNPDKVKQHNSTEKGQEARRQNALKQYRENPEACKARHKEWASKPEVKARRKEYNREYGKIRRAEPTYNARRNKAYKEKYGSDPALKILVSLRTRLYRAVKQAKGGKSGNTMDLLGCSMGRFMEYLKAHFKPGMTFNNYGEWHIDHRRPCASYDLTNPEDQKQCFSWLNLQPLWAQENLSKNDSYNLSFT